VGELPEWLAAVAAQPEPALLVLGMASSDDLARRLNTLCPRLFFDGGHTSLLLAFGGKP
jgi:hypothetical protein